MTRIRTRFLVILLLAAGVPATAGLMLAPGDPAPKLVAPTLDGSTTSVRWTQHRLTVVNFWATWCIPCRDEMPALEKLRSKWAEEGLNVVGVAVDGSREDKVRSMVDSLGVTYPILLGDREIAARWGGGGILPTSYLIDSEGRVLLRVVGGTPEDLARLTERIEAELGAGSGAKADEPAR